MGTLYLVRHGQASAFEENYDRLSKLGERQSRLFGEWWSAYGVEADRVFTGPRTRQQDTASIAVAASGGKLVDAEPLEELDEMRIEPLFKEQMPEIFEKHEHLRGLGAALMAADGDEARGRHMGKLFEAMLQLWGKGQLTAPGVEAWPDFKERVQRALAKVREGFPDPGLALKQRETGRKIVLFTSAGVIAAAAQAALRCEDEIAISLAFRIRNSSLTELLFANERISLLSLNSIPHLPDPTLVTVR